MAGNREFTAEERRAIQKELARKLGPEFISYRPAAGKKVAYLESWQVIGMPVDTGVHMHFTDCCSCPFFFSFLAPYLLRLHNLKHSVLAAAEKHHRLILHSLGGEC